MRNVPEWYKEKFATNKLRPTKLTPDVRAIRDTWVMTERGRTYNWNEVALFARIQSGKPNNDTEEEVQQVNQYYTDLRLNQKMDADRAYAHMISVWPEKLTGMKQDFIGKT
jgi:hypothetical protein